NKVVMTKDKMPRLGASIQNLRDLSRSLWVIGVWAGEVPPSASVETVLIIDEINRANLPSVMGELIYALEYRYDEDNQDQTTVESMYSLKSDEEDVVGNRQLSLPSNLFIIGTMNTADRSVGHIDYAIRRRFAFVEVLPSIEPVKNNLAKEYFEKVSKLFVSNYEEAISSHEIPRNS